MSYNGSVSKNSPPGRESDSPGGGEKKNLMKSVEEFLQ